MAVGPYGIASIAGGLAVTEAFDRYGLLEAMVAFAVMVALVVSTLNLVARAYARTEP